jgi:maltooligosyltrehalose trehalohydrolase
LSQHRFLGYIQDHDQVGNRAIGDRISHIAGLERARIAAALVLTSPFIPMLFQGEEWAASTPFQYFADHDDPELSRAVTEGRKREFAAFGWDPSGIPDPENPATFEASKLKWEETRRPCHREMLAWYRALIHMRRSTPCLNDGTPGKTRATCDEEGKWLRVDRGTISTICNLGKAERTFQIPRGAGVLLASRPIASKEEDAIVLPADTVAVLAAPDHQK